MKRSNYWVMPFITALAGCANFDNVEEVKNVLAEQEEQSEQVFSYLNKVDYNFLGDLANSQYPQGYWKLDVNEVYTAPVSLTFILRSLSDRLSIPLIMDRDTLAMDTTRQFRFSGNVGEYLKFLSETYDVFIDVSAGRLTATGVKEKIFVINSPYFSKNKSTYSYGAASVTKEGGGSGFTGKIDVDIDNDIWKDLDGYLSQQADSDKTFKYSFVKELSHLVVEASYHQMNKLDKIIKKYNDDASTEVKISYKLIAIDEDKLNALSANLSISMSELMIASNDVIGSAGLGIKAASGVVQANGKAKGGWGLSYALLQSGGVLTTSGVTVGLNKKPMPINISTETSYVSKLTREVNDETADAAMTIELSKLEYGLSLIVIPKVIDNKKIALTIGYSRKDLVEIKDYGDGLATVQLPTVNKKEMISDVIVKPDEETLVALFKEDNNTTVDNLDLLAKGMSNQQATKMMALVMSVQRK